MPSNLQSIEDKFRTIKDVGGDGEALAKLTSRTISNMEKVVSDFEVGLQSPTWTGNLENSLSPEEQQEIFYIYQVFKETLSKLEGI